MQIKIVNCYDFMVSRAFTVIKKLVKSNPYAVLGFAAGCNMIGLYKLMIEDCRQYGVSYKHIRAINSYEYKGLSVNNEQSFSNYIKRNLFEKIDISPSNTHFLNGNAENEEVECNRYNSILESLPRDLQILELGGNGSIAFNEPKTDFGSKTHLVDLTISTVRENSELFKDISAMPQKAFTIGIKNIMQAKQIIVFASGEDKSQAVYNLVKGELTEKVPASILQLHPTCTVLVDKAASSLL